MELVFVILAVILLVVLPIAFFLLVMGGLVYALGGTIRGERKEEQPATLVAARGTGVPAVKVASTNGNKGV